MNSVAWAYGTTQALPFMTVVLLMSLWLFGKYARLQKIVKKILCNKIVLSFHHNCVVMYSKILLIDTCVITEKVPLIKIYFVKTSSIILVALKLAMLNPVHTGYRYPTDNQQDCKQPIQ